MISITASIVLFSIVKAVQVLRVDKAHFIATYPWSWHRWWRPSQTGNLNILLWRETKSAWNTKILCGKLGVKTIIYVPFLHYFCHHEKQTWKCWFCGVTTINLNLKGAKKERAFRSVTNSFLAIGINSFKRNSTGPGKCEYLIPRAYHRSVCKKWAHVPAHLNLASRF